MHKLPPRTSRPPWLLASPRVVRLAEAMWDNPDGIIHEVLYPLVGKERLRSLVQEAKTKGS